MIYVLLAEGFEEMEAIAPIDLLRRAGETVCTVSITDDKVVIGAHGIPVTADLTCAQAHTEGLKAVILPGGLPGTTNLEASELVRQLLDYAAQNDLFIGAICAAPSILGHKGLLRGKRAVCYPGYESTLDGAIVEDAPTVIDGNIVTGKGAGVAEWFALALVEAIVSKDTADRLREGIQCK